MLGDPLYWHPSEYDFSVYAAVVPRDHRLRRFLEVVAWDDFEKILAEYYSPDQGRPSEPPVMMLKLELLRWLCNLSDPGVIERTRTDLSFRYFLQIPIGGPLARSPLPLDRNLTGLRAAVHDRSRKWQFANLPWPPRPSSFMPKSVLS